MKHSSCFESSIVRLRAAAALASILFTTTAGVAQSQPLGSNVASPLTAHASVAIPDTPAGRVFQAWFESFNSGDAGQIGAFKQKYAQSGTVQDDLNWHEDIGGYQLIRIDASEPEQLAVLLKEVETDRFTRFEMSVHGDGLGDNLKMRGESVPAPPQFAVQRLALKDALASMTARADEFTKNDRFSGVLLVAQHGTVLLQKSWGDADRETKRPITLDSQFRLGSMTKMFTSVAILQLVEAGRLSFDGTVGQYLPDYPNRDVATKVTVRHLLTHAGGTGDIFGSDFIANRATLRKHSDYLRLFGSRAPAFEPGSKAIYSNYGFVILGAIIEKVSGSSYYDYMQTHIYRVAGMRHAGSLPESTRVAQRVSGYTRRNGEWVSNTDTLPYRGMSAGGGYATAGDLLRFAEALQAGKLISLRMLGEATSPQPHTPAYGYGFQLQTNGPMSSFGHGGGAPGMDADLRIFPTSGYVLIGLSNLDPRASKNMLDHVALRLPDAVADATRAALVR